MWGEAGKGNDGASPRGNTEEGFIFKYDAQINNARTEEVWVRDAYWEFTD
eukprot:COSAG03_NODE_1823_length_3468_cov_8.197091_6_plen_49_part_01